MLLACTAGKDLDTAAPSVRDGDTGTPTDTAAPSDTGHEVLAPWLAADAVWASEDEGYTTGGAFADVDGDGDLDLVAANGNDMEPGLLVVYENDDGVLQTTPSWSSERPRYYGHLDVGDVNGGRSTGPRWPPTLGGRRCCPDRATGHHRLETQDTKLGRSALTR